MSMYAFERRLKDTGISVFSVHPGYVDSEFHKGAADHKLYSFMDSLAGTFRKFSFPCSFINSISTATAINSHGHFPVLFYFWTVVAPRGVWGAFSPYVGGYAPSCLPPHQKKKNCRNQPFSPKANLPLFGTLATLVLMGFKPVTFR